MEDTLLAEFIGEAVVHHHVGEQLGEDGEDVGLGLVGGEQGQHGVDYCGGA